ncbi:butyrophilin subfamily 2 member A2-like isoform X3 [Acanthochromis polyacanthus]|nr:butyrophilin subfamily 2 member A2-like isoform X3 [Acanthochromis polyacanthus]XP_051799870.1 butyrophilin subfamily 2 member A2-like isoform X3 [Acanthochromis polyacanthus]XP_051799871.1 butyrophilin subfamily 2 member A2-like isoform X3 [Acanthochromis polyacanthus]XP_051799872.1 butyrophilin subfamily 2 member A2-like isoform X3 [Acanthochromis polyacanthus]XP_051799873.1 butyrophilin subfamily 2 member A2-like isoform X3 [Acanthochromis polyacanthus]XP_051799874.1 butyrophilin subfami
MSIEWSREDLDPSYVYVWWDKEELESSKHLDYKGRTSLLFNKLEFGDISLKLSKVKLSDEGKYRCFIPTLGRGSTVELVVGIDPFTVISLAGLGRTSSSVELQCESAGWYPEPEVLWLDGDGNLLSAGPTETVRGPDDLYTVSSRVTVEKKHSNKFTCRVQQKNINQSREALIQVTDDFFNVQSSYTSTIIGLAVSSAAALILFSVLFVHIRRQNRKKKTLVNEKQEELERLERNNSEANNQLQQEKQRNENAESEMKTLNRRLEEYMEDNVKLMETKRKLLNEKLTSIETERKLKTVIQNMMQELDEMNFAPNSDPTGSDEKNQQEELEKLQDEKQKWMKTVVNLKTELQDMNQELKLAGPIIMEEVNERDRYISLKNISTEEMELKGWKLTLHRNGELLVRFTFNESFKRQAGEILCIAHPSWFSKHPDDVDLVWSELKYWIPGDKMKMNLISNNGELFRLL